MKHSFNAESSIFNGTFMDTSGMHGGCPNITLSGYIVK